MINGLRNYSGNVLFATEVFRGNLRAFPELTAITWRRIMSLQVRPT
jgi:hypothetical protein